MKSFLHTLLRGTVVTVLLPFILLIWALYAVYCAIVFIITFVVRMIGFFKGKNGTLMFQEEIESQNTLIQKEKTEQRKEQIINTVYERMAEAAVQSMQNQPIQPKPAPQVPFGVESFNGNAFAEIDGDKKGGNDDGFTN